jgi:general secretion pathway protein H
MRERGFTLLESMVVLTILFFSLVIVSPSIQKIQQSIEVRATIKKISSLLRYYRTEAINKGKVFIVTLERDSKSIKVFSVETLSEEGEVEKKLLKNVPIPEGIQIKEVKGVSIRFPLAHPSFEFYPEGGSSGGSILLSGPGDKEFEILLDLLTGSVEVKRV